MMKMSREHLIRSELLVKDEQLLDMITETEGRGGELVRWRCRGLREDREEKGNE